jgi:hypothetical protein
MLEKDEGKINEIVYNHTAYYNGRYRFYPTITDLNGIIDEIIGANTTTDYIRITPFYINERVNMQTEFEEYMYYIECRERVDEEIQKQHIEECIEPVDVLRALQDVEFGPILYPLCQNGDSLCFKKALVAYKKALTQMIF